ncbi:hypothetical protein PISL3812_01799 [Talaromyces islandicus]|uniref:Uncharacterized protein n=1 Tax=Talaromyces islandicus TaxID=28573 RepID=A0A0U1LQB3_TALIS|nr:hypothetical protein PISL3812_01799 [Talaromyces islandicus]
MADQGTPSSTGFDAPHSLTYSLAFKYNGEDKWLDIDGYGNIDSPFKLSKSGRYTISLEFRSIPDSEDKAAAWRVSGQVAGRDYMGIFSGRGSNIIHIQCNQTGWFQHKGHDFIEPVEHIVMGSGCYLNGGTTYEILVIFDDVGICLEPQDPDLIHLEYIREFQRNLTFYVKVA